MAATGLLPRWRTFSTGSAFDTAGFGSAAEQTGRLVRFGWTSSNRLGIVRHADVASTRAGANVPHLGHCPAPADGYLTQIEQGFCLLWEHLIGLKGELLDPTGPLSALSTAGARHLVRPTERYGTLLERSVLPDVLIDGAARSIAIDGRLAQHASGLDVSPEVFRAELDALEDFDIPRFALDPERPVFIAPHAGMPAADVIVPGAAAARDRISALDDAHLADELFILRASFHGRVGPASASELGGPRSNVCPAGRPLDRATALRWASRIASEVLSQAIRGNDGTVTWFVPRMDHAVEGCNLIPMGPGFYGGVTGVALLFAALFRLSGDANARVTALAAVRTAVDGVHRLSARLPVGASTGIGSVAYGVTVPTGSPSWERCSTNRFFSSKHAAARIFCWRRASRTAILT